jgi:hypothetical protein
MLQTIKTYLGNSWIVRTSGVETPDMGALFGTAGEVAEKSRQSFLQGLKPSSIQRLYVGAEAPTS